MMNESIIVCCFGVKQHFTSRKDAIKLYYNAMENCTNNAEYDSYSKIFVQLMQGANYCTD